MAISPSVAELRAVVGSRLLLLPTVAVLPRDRDGRILLVRPIGSGLWANRGRRDRTGRVARGAAVVLRAVVPLLEPVT